MAALVGQLPAAAPPGADAGRAAGSEVLVFYRDPHTEWHARLVLARVGAEPGLPGSDVYVVLTPDSDMYPEDLGPGSREIASVRDRPADRSIPYGVPADQVYDFAQLPTAADLVGLCAEAERLAGRERLNLGVRPLAAPPLALPAAAGGAGGVGGRQEAEHVFNISSSPCHIYIESGSYTS